MASAFQLSSLCPTAFVGPLPRRSFLGARLSLPPLFLSPYNRTCPTTLPTNGRVVSWACASASRWPRPSWWLPTPVSVLFLTPPLPTPCPSSSGSGSALGLVAVIGRSVGTPRHERGHGPGYRGCYPWGQVQYLTNKYRT